MPSRPDTLTPSALPVIEGRAWSCIDFISDLHLCEQQPRTFEVWRDYLASTPAQALFILGDLFEVWIGDDVLQDPDAAFERSCVEALHRASQRMAVHVMCGNRDFLMGDALWQRTGAHALPDPAVLQTDAQRVLLSHGDAWCLDDTEYLDFRAQVRSASWQQAFLARPLQDRSALAREMRDTSESRKRIHTTYADVDDTLSDQWLHLNAAQVLVHGHTHRPATHTLPSGALRHVLSDWEADASPPRAQVLRWQGTWHRVDLL
jgi:UDP-2,3-diacylglucosamine hydrolase